MPSFGRVSESRLATCHPKLQKVFREVIKHVDCSILEGHREEERHIQLKQEGRTTVDYEDSTHSKTPSEGVDSMRYPISWTDLERQTLFAGFVLGIAQGMGIKLIWGNDWDRDFETKDTNFNDYPHFQLHPDEV